MNGAVNGPGVTATTIALGIPYYNDAYQANAAAGAGSDSEDPGDTREYYKAAIDDVNERGGVLGRKLVPIFHAISASQDFDLQSQKACEDWTQDHKVFMIFLRGPVANECARKAGILVDGGFGNSATGPVYARYPNLFAASAIRLERLGSVTVRAMVRAGWQKPDAKWPTGKIGLITWDDPEYRYAMKNGYLQALHAAGLHETDVRYVAVPESDQSLGVYGAQVSSAVLAFNRKEIDHVFIADGAAGVTGGAGITLPFLTAAKAQHYYPRYGFNTYNAPGWANLPADEQVGMLAIDSLDDDRTNDAGIALNPQRERCWALMKKRGLKVGASNTHDLAIYACEYAWFPEAILKRSSGTTLPYVIAGAESLGTSYRSPWIFGTRLGRGQHDGAALFRNSRFEGNCACMRYTSKPYEP